MSTREEELAALIEEQARDDRPFQPPEDGVVLSLDAMGGLPVETFGRNLVRPRDPGDLHHENQAPTLSLGGCSIHGYADLYTIPGESQWNTCRPCAAERERMKRATDPAFRARRNAASAKQYLKRKANRKAACNE